MTDNLVKRLRLWEYVFPGDELKKPGHLYHEAADRIEALEAALAEKEAVVAHMRADLEVAAARLNRCALLVIGPDSRKAVQIWADQARAALNTPDPKAGG